MVQFHPGPPKYNAPLVQRLERRTYIPVVGGSNPSRCTNYFFNDGECNSVGRVQDCDSCCRGFDPHHSPQIINKTHRSVAQFGRASGLGPEGRQFESGYSDHF